MLAAQRDERRQRGRDGEAETETDRVGRSDGDEHDTGEQADDALGAHADAVGAELARARERAAREELEAEGEERDHEADDQPDVAGEQVVDERRRHRQDDRGDPEPGGEQQADQSRAADDGRAADAVRAPRRERAADLLLDGEEDARARARTRTPRGR